MICRPLPLLLLLLSLFSLSHCLRIEIGPSATECFAQDVTKGDFVEVSFQVLSGGFLDIDLEIKDPRSRVIHEYQRQSEGKYSTNADDNGFYTFCFSNKMSTVTPKKLSFKIIAEEPDSEIAKSDHIDPLEDAVYMLSDYIGSVDAQMVYMKNREQARRDTSESTNARILWFSVFEFACLVGVNLWQIYNLKTFFEVRRTM